MSLGSLQAALATATNGITVAASNINFDFTLVKYEAPKEFQPLGELLSAKKKSAAETGEAHVTARRLGALFEDVCPPTPNLLRAYGTRVSEIPSTVNHKEPPGFGNSMFLAYRGIDGTSIWAAATSSKAALHIHLLACMLARLFEASEAVSIWVEFVKKRGEEIARRVEHGEPVPFSVAAAAGQQEIHKSQLAEWDASARAWLQTADEIKKNENTQLRTLFRDINIQVSQNTDVFSSVTEAWKSALSTAENLVNGTPQAVQDGSILLGLSAWHMYPNLAVFGTQNFVVNMSDHLVSPGGVLSLGLVPSTRSSSDSGVFWSLCLANLRHYGKPVKTERRLQQDPTKINFQQFLLVALGAVMGRWQIPQSDTRTAMRFLLAFCNKCSGDFKSISNAASTYLSIVKLPWPIN